MNKLFAICQKDPRYDMEAYLFLREALECTVHKLKKSASGPHRHISGRELAQGFREYAIEQFGPLTLAVLAKWGVHRSEDIGAIVFNLVEAGELGKTEEDTLQDFSNLFDFYEVFQKPFEPTTEEEP
ncbi:MAG: Minf_1886 family protein [Kiritimatiellia bacterium]